MAYRAGCGKRAGLGRAALIRSIGAKRPGIGDAWARSTDGTAVRFCELRVPVGHPPRAILSSVIVGIPRFRLCLDNPTLAKITAMTAGWPACARLAAVAPAGQPIRYTTPEDTIAAKASPRNYRCLVAEIRRRQVLKVLATAAWAARKRWAEPGERKPCVCHSRRRIGTCELSARLFLRFAWMCSAVRPSRAPPHDRPAADRSPAPPVPCPASSAACASAAGQPACHAGAARACRVPRTRCPPPAISKPDYP
jgi:hypothetical protein